MNWNHTEGQRSRGWQMFRVSQGVRVVQRAVSSRPLTTKIRGFFVPENIPKIGFVIGACALAVQVALLYPKHEILSQQFLEVEKIVHRVAGITHSLDSRLNDILHLEKEIKVKERRILDKGNEIFNSELNTIKKIDEILALQAVMSPAAAIVEAQ